MSQKKINKNRRALNKYCFCSGRYLWRFGFKEGQFVHAWGCPLRIKNEKNKFVRKMQKLLSTK